MLYDWMPSVPRDFRFSSDVACHLKGSTRLSIATNQAGNCCHFAYANARGQHKQMRNDFRDFNGQACEASRPTTRVPPPPPLHPQAMVHDITDRGCILICSVLLIEKQLPDSISRADRGFNTTLHLFVNESKLSPPPLLACRPPHGTVRCIIRCSLQSHVSLQTRLGIFRRT